MRTGHGGSPSIEQPDYWWYRARADMLQAALGGFVGEPSLVLDVGSADGPSVGWLRGRGRKVSLDVDPRGLGEGGVCGSALALPFADGVFDVVAAFDVVEHCQPEQQAVAEIARVLAPGGRLLLSVPAYQWAWTDFDEENGHYRRYTRSRAVAAVEAGGLRVDRATYAFTSVFPVFVVERLARRLRGALRPRAPRPSADVVSVPSVPRVAEAALLGLSRVDRGLLRRRDLPFGSSVFLAATKCPLPEGIGRAPVGLASRPRL